MKQSDNIFLDRINEYFKENGAWEQGGGPRQTELFARCFDQVISLPEKKITLLDVGCALGQAAVFFARRYPEAVVSATDISDVAIRRGQERYGETVHFFIEDIGRIQGEYDVIYCSNVLEHFYDFKEKTRYLSRCCRRLCIMVPYKQQKKGRDLVPDAGSIEHQYTFFTDSFDFLLDEGLAKNIQTLFHPCPVAWGWSKRQRITHGLDNIIRKISRRPQEREPMQVIFDINTTV